MARTSITRAKHTGPQSPRLSIMKILKRRKKTLKQWADELGHTTLSNAEQWCDRMGVLPPTHEEWAEHVADPDLPPLVSDPSGGVIVLNTSSFLDEDETDIIDEVVYNVSEDESVFNDTVDEVLEKKTTKRSSRRKSKTSSSDN